MSRLDRLGPAKELALLASVIGREFSYPLIAAASPDDEPRLRAGLAQLVESELVFQVGEPPDARYRFKHALIRDEAYQSLFRSARRQYHERIGQTLEAQFPHEAEARPELVAHHFLEAGDSARGVQYLAMAARRAVTTSANVEAIHAADQALEVLSGWPESAQRSQLEMSLFTLRGVALIAIRGYASDEVQDTFARARELANMAGGGPQLVPVLHGLWLFHMVRGDRGATHDLADQLLAIAEVSDDTTEQLFGLTVGGIQRFFEGRFQDAVGLRRARLRAVRAGASQPARRHVLARYCRRRARERSRVSLVPRLPRPRASARPRGRRSRRGTAGIRSRSRAST